MSDTKDDLVKKMADAYLKFGKDPIEAIGKMPWMDEFQILQMQAQIEALKKERDPAQYFNQLARLAQGLQGEVAARIGLAKYRDKVEGLGFETAEERLGLYRMFGGKELDKYINPE